LDKNGNCKIGDFGVSAIVGDNDKLVKTEGTYQFMCPESIGKDGNKKGYSGKAADIWAMGLCFYCCIYGKLPFYST